MHKTPTLISSMCWQIPALERYRQEDERLWGHLWYQKRLRPAWDAHSPSLKESESAGEAVTILIFCSFLFLCAVLMYRGKALEDFTGPDCRFVNFKKGDDVYVYYKLAGGSPEVWAGSVSKMVKSFIFLFSLFFCSTADLNHFS